MSSPHAQATIDRIRKLTTEGLAASSIATKLGLTRNTVLGIRHRHLHELVAPRPRAPSKLRKLRQAKTVAALPARAKSADKNPKTVIQRPSPELPTETSVTAVRLLELGTNACHWPIGANMYCGAPRGSHPSYCNLHKIRSLAAAPGFARGGDRASPSPKDHPRRQLDGRRDQA